MLETKAQQEWKDRIALFKKAGGSKTTFCRQQGFKYSQFLYWLHKLTPKPTKMIPVTVTGSMNCLAVIELRSGRQLKITSPHGLRCILNEML